MVILGFIIFMISQFLLKRWIKKYNKEWLGGLDHNGVS